MICTLLGWGTVSAAYQNYLLAVPQMKKKLLSVEQEKGCWAGKNIKYPLINVCYKNVVWPRLRSLHLFIYVSLTGLQLIVVLLGLSGIDWSWLQVCSTCLSSTWDSCFSGIFSSWHVAEVQEGKPSQVSTSTTFVYIMSHHISLVKASYMTKPSVNGVEVNTPPILLGGSSRDSARARI